MMPRPTLPGGARRLGILGAVLRLGTFRAEGMTGIPEGRQAFLNSFTPMLALALVGGFLVAMSGHVAFALESIGSTVVAMLGQPVVSHWFAVRWGREGPWLRYATAVNWCQWAPMLAIFVLMPAPSSPGVAVPILVGLLFVWRRRSTTANWRQWAPVFAVIVLAQVAINIGMRMAPDAVAVALIAYALALAFFLARVGLGISRGRAVLLVVAVHVALAIVVEGPALISLR